MGSGKLKKLQCKIVAIKKILDLKQNCGDRPKCVNIVMDVGSLKALVVVVYGGLLYCRWLPEGHGN